METAIKASDFDGVSALLASGASVLVAAGKFTPLALAVQRGLREIADLLLDHGADPNLAIVAGNSSPPPRAAGDACLTPQRRQVGPRERRRFRSRPQAATCLLSKAY
jgi:ankyrin repeat protein